jgi:hypothetical protein
VDRSLSDEQKLKKTFELTELARKLNMARDAAEHPGLSEKELKRRFSRRMVYRKDAAAKQATAKQATARQARSRGTADQIDA